MKRRKLKVSLVVLAFVGLTAAFSTLYSTIAIHAQAESPKQSGSATLSCPKCKGAMERGLILDYYTQNRLFCQSEWVPGGLPERNLFGGVKDMPTNKILTYRCTNCSYLESYAK
jgi:predicted nucleic-acid-binding Zn-ribbon protein